MAEKEEIKAEKKLTYGQQLYVDGWPQFFPEAHGIDLENPDRDYGAFGFTDQVGEKRVVVVLPSSEWIKLLTEFAKKQAKK